MKSSQWSGAATIDNMNSFVRFFHTLPFFREKAIYDAPAIEPVGIEALSKDSFFFCRIIGNDLVPRHSAGQSYSNVKFIVENEPAFENCTKFWIVNRIWDEGNKSRIIDYLEAKNQEYFVIPFDIDIYSEIEHDFFCSEFDRNYIDMSSSDRRIIDSSRRRSKNIYAINNNGARNAAIEIGSKRAYWVMPWDGNVFLTSVAWKAIRSGVIRQGQHRYFHVPMVRVANNDDVLRPKFAPKASEEPQLIFRADASQRFDERYDYGRRPKVELLWRLGVPGIWDKFKLDQTDLPRPVAILPQGACPSIGWVARLASGKEELETGSDNAKLRNAARADAVVAALDRLDLLSLRGRLDRSRLTFYDESKLGVLAVCASSQTRDRLLECAEVFERQVLQTVVDKSEAAPGGVPNDYWSIAPYWWPNPDAPDGLPFVRRDGQRRPEADLFGAGSEQYDRARLFSMVRGVTHLALAWRVTKAESFALKAAEVLTAWFVDPITKMTPNLEFAQTRAGRLNGRGASSGIVETKDFYFFVDALRILEQSPALSTDHWTAIRGWFGEYLRWLTTSGRGKKAAARENNLGTMYDLQCGAIAAYLGDAEELSRVLRRARSRLSIQFDVEGRQPGELSRANGWHYCTYNLVGWTALARLASTVGDRLWVFSLRDGRSIELAINWLLSNAPRQDGDGFCVGNLGPLVVDGAELRQPSQGLGRAALANLSLDSGYAPFVELSRSAQP